MTIASEIQDLQTNLAAAKAAVTAKGGTVGNTGLAGLATEIASIPSGGTPAAPETLYGSALVYPFASKTYALDPDDPMIDMCTINSINSVKLSEFTAEYPPQHNPGEPVIISFNYDEDYDNPGNYVWRYGYENPETGFEELKIAEADMLSTTGIDVTVDSGETWAYFELPETITVNEDVVGWVDVLSATEYNNLGIKVHIDPEGGQIWDDTDTYVIGGMTFNRAQIKGFAFGTANTTTPSDGYVGFLEGCNNLVELNFDYASSLTSIGRSFLSKCTSFNAPLDLSNITSIDYGFLYECRSFNQPITIHSNFTSIGQEFMRFCDSMVSNFTCEAPASVIASGYTSFATWNTEAPCYVDGIPMKGTYRAEWMTKFPNRTSGEVRKLIDGGA